LHIIIIIIVVTPGQQANKASANAEAERKVATERLSKYKAGEERRTHAVLAKCTKLLNEKKRKIQSLKH